jgi:hypothetical protein
MSARSDRRARLASATQTEGGDECAVALYIDAAQVVQQTTATADEHQQATAAVVVLLVHLEVLREVCDAVGEERDLHLGRTGVGGSFAVFGDDV